MVTPDKLYAATDDGLRIIALHYPEAPEAARNNKAFRARADERTPSARLRLFTNGGKRVWKMTDFGDEGRAIDPIQVHMDAKGISFREAILDLSSIFNISDEINRSVNRPDIRKQAASAEQDDGACDWESDQEFTDEECAIMGPRVTPEHLKALHWHRVKHIVNVRNREATYKYSNEHYPIFLRECWFTGADGKANHFYKIYEPLNADKQWRFQYQPKGKKPQNYINGLFELAAAYTEYNETEERAFRTDPENDNKTYKKKKLPEAVICSGERDAICVRSLGYHPLWFNSETYKVTVDEYRQITRYVETVYNIPDIDATGRKKGTELALRFINIHTIWLPEKLASYRDHRGNPRKDFRDWMEIWKTNSDFRGLLELATPAKFWTMQWVSGKDENGKSLSRHKYNIDISCLREFLKLNGFFILKDKHAPGPQYIRMEGNIIKPVTPKEIRDFVHSWTVDTARPRELRNLVLTSPALSSAALLDALMEIDPDFTNNTEQSQYFYFPSFSVEITGNGMTKHDNRATIGGRYVMEEDVIQHNINFLPDMFTITHPDGKYDSPDFDIEIGTNTSKYFCYLINSSRIYWRKELEQMPEEWSAEQINAYRKDHKFDIAGPRLTADEIQEQKQCLINKIFTIGFMLHRFKSESRGWSPFVMDNVVGENDQCNGRSGKSFMFRALSHFVRWLKLSGRNPRLLENQFAFEQINKQIGIVVIDDCDEYFPFKQFYDNITSDITINTKNVSAYTLKYDEAPKFAFTTNYVPKDFDASSVGRMLFVVFSDYYHVQTEDNDYLETRGIRDDFGKDLCSSAYTESEWEADINFMLQCVRFYLSVSNLPVKIQPRMDNIIFRKHLRDMSDNFRDWAESYFSIDENGNGEHINCEIIREEAFNDFKRFSGKNSWSMQRFTKALKGFCYTCEYVAELNPSDRCNCGSRILRRIEDPISKRKIQREMIYLRSKKEAAHRKNPPPAPPEQKALFGLDNDTEGGAPF